MNKLRNSLVVMVALAAVSFTSCSKSNDAADEAAAQATADSLAAVATADSLAAIEAAALVAADTTVMADTTVAE
jgi:predicted outer membrane protein